MPAADTATSIASPARAVRALLWRDLTLAWRRRSDIVNPLVFFVIVVTLFPLGLGPEVNLLARLAPGIVWVAALLAALLALENIVHADYEDGTLEQMLLSPHPTVLFVLAKIFAHWLVAGLPLVCIAPLLGVLLHAPPQVIEVVVVTLLLGTPCLSLIGAVGAALTLSQRRGGMLMSILVLPLYVPVLIMGSAGADAAAAGLPADPYLSLLGALLVLSITLAPWAICAAIRIAFE
ncbi:MAG: heme exporter protein CcmB [Gammaproteobacteria bacterium]